MWNCLWGYVLKYILGSIVRVGYCIPVPDFYLVLAAEKKHYNGLIIGMGEGLGKAYTYLFINVNRPLGQHTCF